MKQLKRARISVLFMLCCFTGGPDLWAQDSAAVAVPTVNLRYFADTNNIPYLLVQSRTKAGNKYQPLPKQVVQLYLDSNGAENLISKTYTNENGLAKVIIPPSMKDRWKSSPQHQFIGVLEASSKEEEITTTLDITIAKMEIDTSTADGVRSIAIQVRFLQNNEWVPAQDVEMKIGVVRHGSILSAGDEETYTTDSTGIATAAFKRDSLPGDQLGNIILTAKVEDNDQYGNLVIEKKVPWGIATKPATGFFDQRTLWSTRFRTPFWLLLIAYSIVISVWTTLIYLVFQLVKIKKLSKKIV